MSHNKNSIIKKQNEKFDEIDDETKNLTLKIFLNDMRNNIIINEIEFKKTSTTKILDFRFD